jgi:hypothetical protein
MMVASESVIYYRIIKAERGSPMRVHNVADKSDVCYLHNEGAQFVAKRIHDAEC